MTNDENHNHGNLSVKLIIFLSISLNIHFGAQGELSVLIWSQTI